MAAAIVVDAPRKRKAKIVVLFVRDWLLRIDPAPQVLSLRCPAKARNPSLHKTANIRACVAF